MKSFREIFLENRLSLILNFVSIIFFSLFLITLWIFVVLSPPIIAVMILSLFLLAIPILNIYFVFKSYDKPRESIPLMKHRMNKFLTISIFCFSIGLPLLLDAYNRGGFIDNTIQTSFALTIIFIGLGFWSVGYLRRDNLIERELIRRNKKNMGGK